MNLSVIIPARNEMFLQNTIDDVLKNIRGDTEVIVILDGCWPEQSIPQHERLRVMHYPQSIGQRAAPNEGARISPARHVMKLDAHCAVAEGFDATLIEDCRPDWTMVPAMYNLHAFDWVCENGHRRYQGPSGVCKECGKETKREIVWVGKDNPQSFSYRFNKELRFQYWQDYKKKQTGDIVDTLSLQGSCFMCTRDMYWERELCDE